VSPSTLPLATVASFTTPLLASASHRSLALILRLVKPSDERDGVDVAHGPAHIDLLQLLECYGANAPASLGDVATSG